MGIPASFIPADGKHLQRFSDRRGIRYKPQKPGLSMQTEIS